MSLYCREGAIRERQERARRALGDFFFPLIFLRRLLSSLPVLYALERVKRGGKNTNPNERQYTTLYTTPEALHSVEISYLSTERDAFKDHDEG